MEIRHRNFFSEISTFITSQRANVVVVVIDESPVDFKSVMVMPGNRDLATKEQIQQRWHIVTTHQLKLLSWAADKSTCMLCEITYGGASTEQISGILSQVPRARVASFSKREPNALKDDRIREYVEQSPEHWVVMGYHTNACVNATCGAGPLSDREGNGGLLQYRKKVYTADSVLHPEPPSAMWETALKADCKAMQFFFDTDMGLPAIPAAPPPPDDC